MLLPRCSTAVTCSLTGRQCLAIVISEHVILFLRGWWFEADGSHGTFLHLPLNSSSSEKEGWTSPFTLEPRQQKDWKEQTGSFSAQMLKLKAPRRGHLVRLQAQTCFSDVLCAGMNKVTTRWTGGCEMSSQANFLGVEVQNEATSSFSPN